MKKKLVTVLIIVVFLLFAIIGMNYINQKISLFDENKLITVSANTPNEAAVALGEKLFECGSFDEMSITEFQMLDCLQLNEYKELTTKGRVFSYELIYKFKTDDSRAFIDNKIIIKPVETDVWIDDVVARICIVMFEYEDVYYKLFNWDEISLNKDFVYNNGEYGGSDTSPKDRLECYTIKAVFENQYNISNLNISENPPVESIKNKLFRDIEMHVKPEYQIEKSATEIYNFTFNDEYKAICFNADLYDEFGNEIVKNTVFALCLDGGFSIYDIENLVPKSIE